MATHASIEYVEKETGDMVHSDLCPPQCTGEISDEHRRILHEALDEAINAINKGYGEVEFSISSKK